MALTSRTQIRASFLACAMVAVALLAYFFASVPRDANIPQEMIAAVAKHILLPEDEVPQVAVITHPEDLSDQPFFAEAVPGDIVLVYEKNKKAILYNPTLDKIIEVGPIVVKSGTEEVSSSSFSGDFFGE